MTTSTVQTSNAVRTVDRNVRVFYGPSDQLLPHTTEYIAMHQYPLIATAPATSIHPPRNWALVWSLDGLEQTPESERWPVANWPSPQAFLDTRTFIEALPNQPIPLPNLGLADDGEINFLWDEDGFYIDLGFYGTGTYSFFARGKTNEGFYDDDIPASGGLPQAILELLVG